MDLTPEVLDKWQRLLDVVAKLVGVPSAVITMIEAPLCTCYRTVVSSASPGNPFPIDQLFALDIGTYCEEVIKTRAPLLVENALEDVAWLSAPELGVGMVSYLGFPVIWPDGRVFGTVCVLDSKANAYGDVHQDLLRHCREVLEDDLRMLARFGEEIDEQKNRLDELFARVPAAIAMVDGDSRIVRVNPSFTRIFGYSAAEALGRRTRDLIVPDDRQEEAEGLFHRLALADEAFEVETVRTHKDGTRVSVSVVCVPISTNGTGGAGYIIYRDLTESRRLQEEQRRHHQVQLELVQAQRVATLGLLSASIAHELNQPLTGIVTNCGTAVRMLTRDTPQLDGALDAMTRTMRDATRAADIVARVRALFRDRHEPATDGIDLNDAALEVVALLRSDCDKARVRMNTALAAGLPPVSADRVQIQQVIMNLLRNAIEAVSDVPDLRREVRLGTALDAAGWVRLSVTDAGCGLQPGVDLRMYEPFYSTKADGMGIGLALSRSIIEKHGGHLRATPNEGPGTTFAVTIPCLGEPRQPSVIA
ncbi:hypothetical protein TBR22_A18630 [Luteitalea sp. TBR-22]|uniref:PAS domain S-box protein n=1 Tax=Luteitalea sp. TBR-22 TaxID=2802971 RepID=UPI001AFB6F8E|nr:PAS domain S-box protein [Luteitalea sp. TBR-22]BCS32649.1 hypothetical protein TBR22_A18630 [Luteitalea sp. TBR-22]